MNESEKIKLFKDFKSTLQLSDYNDYYINCVISHLNIVSLGRKINMNSYFDNQNQANDRIKLINALKYIDCSDELKGRRIIFDDNNFDTFAFHLDSKVKFNVI